MGCQAARRVPMRGVRIFRSVLGTGVLQAEDMRRVGRCSNADPAEQGL